MDTGFSNKSLLVELQVIAPDEPHNACGQCRACCVAFGIPEMDKPPHVPCKHLCDHGCGIYSTRPNVCRTFRCVWLQSNGDEIHRPDNLGLLLTTELVSDTSPPFVVAYEIRPGAFAKGLSWLKKLSENNGVPVCVVTHRADDIPHQHRPRLYLNVPYELQGSLRRRFSQSIDGVKAERNSPCPCGSNKKFKKCCMSFIRFLD